MIGTWGVPQGVPKCFREGGYGQNGLDPLDPKITTHVRAAVRLGGLGWAWARVRSVRLGWV